MLRQNVHVSIIGSTIIVIPNYYYYENNMYDIKSVFQYISDRVVAPTVYFTTDFIFLIVKERDIQPRFYLSKGTQVA